MRLAEARDRMGEKKGKNSSTTTKVVKKHDLDGNKHRSKRGSGKKTKTNVIRSNSDSHKEMAGELREELQHGPHVGSSQNQVGLFIPLKRTHLCAHHVNRTAISTKSL